MSDDRDNPLPHDNPPDNPATNPKPDVHVGSRPQPGQTGPGALPPEAGHRPSGNPRGGAEKVPGTAKDDPGKGIKSPQPTRDNQGQPLSKPSESQRPQGQPSPNQGKPGGPKGR